MIPKIVMQTWKTHDIPNKWKISPESIKKHMPKWKYVLQTDEDNRNLIKDCYPQYIARYDSYPNNIQRVDFSRYAWLHKYGGLYLDLDFEMTRSLEPLLQRGDLFFLPSENGRWRYNNSVMASAPGHPFWVDLMDYIVNQPKRFYWNTVNQVMMEAGPGAVQHVLERHHYPYVVLPDDVRPACMYLCDEVPERAILRPLPGLSWAPNRSLLLTLRWCACHWKVTGIITAAAILLLLFLLISHVRITVAYKSF
jgi:inositol phosphorylceramide mannosyltransferase catalytic subunit